MLSLAPDTTSSCFVVDNDLTIPRLGGYFLQYLPGFICYNFLGKPRIYNPTTRLLVTLPAAMKSNNIMPIPPPPPGESIKIVAYYFGHDHVIDQYKVLCSTGVRLRNFQEIRSEHRVFVRKAGGRGSWKKAAPTSPADFLPHIPLKGGVCIDGVIYYMGWTDSYNSVLVSFHIRSGDFKMIQVPRRDGDELPGRVKNVSLIEFGGKATIIDQTNLREKGRLDLWAVEDAGNNKWSRRSLVLQPSQLHLVNYNIIFNVKALVVVKTGLWLYTWENPNGKLSPGSMGFPVIVETVKFSKPYRFVDMPPFVEKKMSKLVGRLISLLSSLSASGSLFRTSILSSKTIVWTDPEVNFEIFKTREQVFHHEIYFQKLLSETLGKITCSSSKAQELPQPRIYNPTTGPPSNPASYLLLQEKVQKSLLTLSDTTT
ncbi:F-box associated interaction domain [Arabidopsis suecica]|uniref:F-box associated interaction domain n=1 Tax=Arabidopsis suecica TaxID=45249 RepID=A0A8T2AHD1_ARASU|nr:F-box associated interaction domain [Arabidopsis suecica]